VIEQQEASGESLTAFLPARQSVADGRFQDSQIPGQAQKTSTSGDMTDVEVTCTDHADELFGDQFV